jgi:hypothetical protein
VVIKREDLYIPNVSTHFAAMHHQHGRTLAIEGTTEADSVSVFKNHDRIQVLWGDASGNLLARQEFKEGRVRRITFNGNGGSDVFFNGTELRVTTTGTVKFIQSGGDHHS